MIALVIVVLGLAAAGRLPVSLLPDVELPRLTVRTFYPGASPEVVERRITQVIEEMVAAVPGIQEMTSTSSEGDSRVRVTFGSHVNLDTAALDVQMRLENGIGKLPKEAARPRISKFDLTNTPVVTLGVSSDLDPIEITQLIDNQVRHRLGRIPGVAQVDPWGGSNREIRVELDSERLRSLGLSINTLNNIIRNANLDLPAGTVESGNYEFSLRSSAEFENLDALRNQVIAIRNGAAVRLGQIADIDDSYQAPRWRARINGRHGLRIAIRKESSANTIDVAQAVLQEVEALRVDFPQLHIVAMNNQGNFIENSISNVSRSVIYGGLLAIVIILFFLRNLRSTVVIALSIPISILATLAVMFFAGLSLNLMTLGGLALGVGMMVDSSIVVLENIFRLRDEDQKSPAVAAVEGALEVSGAIVASTLTTLVIFLPLVFVRGTTGLLFKEFAYVVAIALICSLGIALTLVPMLSAKVLSSQASVSQTPSRHGVVAWLSHCTGALLTHLENSYRSVLAAALHLRWTTLITAAVLLGLSWLLVPYIGSEFLPASDDGALYINGEMGLGTRLDLVDRQTQKLDAAVIQAVPEVVSRITRVGPLGWRANAGATGSINLTLSPAAQRTRSNQDIANDLRKQLDGTLAGMTLRVYAPRGQYLLNRILPNGGGMQVEIRGHDLDTLDALATTVAQRVTAVSGIADADPGQRTGTPQQRITINRERTADAGLTLRQVSEALEIAVVGQQAGSFHAQDKHHPIRIILKNARHLPLEKVLQLTLQNPSGDSITLDSLVSVSPSVGPTYINRRERQRTLSVKLNVTNAHDPGTIAKNVVAAIAEIPKPQGYSLRVTGNYEEQQKSFRELKLNIALALLLVYMVLASQYESLRDPFVVMLSVPMAGIGVLLMLFLTQTTLNLQSYIGCIMLAGIVVNNAILLVDQAGQLRRNGLSTHDAVVEAGRRRLRPILMTSITTLLGLLPLALALGEGTEAQAPLARAVIGGLLGSMLITLVVVPVAYTLIHPDRQNSRKESTP